MPGVALTVATNDEATELNQHIRTRRVEAGQVDDARTNPGADGLPIGAGDVVQTRHNNKNLAAANRQTWIIQGIAEDGSVWAKETGTDRKHQHTLALPPEYVAEHVHLAYANTAYGIQGASLPASHTVLSDGLDAAGLYVGMTRGKETNTIQLIAENTTEARAQFIEAVERDRADRGLETATTRAREAVTGLIQEGPVKLVTDEIAALTARAEKAERQAQVWEQLAARLKQQQARHHAEAQDADQAVSAAEYHAAQTRVQVSEPLLAKALQDGEQYLHAREEQARTAGVVASAGWFSRRKATRVHHQAQEHTQARRAGFVNEWGSLPATGEDLDQWAETVSARRAEAHPRLTAAQQEVTTARQQAAALEGEHREQRLALYATVFGAEQVRQHSTRYQVAQPEEEARKRRRTATVLRAEAEHLRTLPPEQAARRVRRWLAPSKTQFGSSAEVKQDFIVQDREAPRRDRQEGPELSR